MLPMSLGMPDLPVSGGSSRAYSGAVMEEIIKALFGLHPGIQNGLALTCPDAFTPTNKPVEIKSLKRGSKLVIYDWRSAKEIPETLYFIGIHRRKPCASLREIWEQTSFTMNETLIIPEEEIRRMAQLQPLQKIKTERTSSGVRNGYQRKGYNEGYRSIPYQQLIDTCIQLPVKSSTLLHGLAFNSSILLSKKLLD